jgi:hypothetical protein
MLIQIELRRNDMSVSRKNMAPISSRSRKRKGILEITTATPPVDIVMVNHR